MLRDSIGAVFAMLAVVSGAYSATVEGFVEDGKTSVLYNSTTGAFGIQPDGQPVGQYRILSDSANFNATPALVPPGGIASDIDSATEKSWRALPAAALSANFDLGIIAPTGLSKEFLVDDLTLTGSGGLGTPSRAFDLVYLSGAGGGIVVVDAHLSGGLPGIHFTHQFTTSSGEPPITWSNLTPIVGNPIPNILPTLSATGQFNWNTAGSPLGVYAWDVTATNAAGSDTGRLAILLLDTPEPSAFTLIGMAAPIILGSFRRQPSRCH